MEEGGVARRQHQYQQHLQVARPHTVVNRLTRESSGECVSSSDDELAGETHFEARVGILCRKKSSKVQFEQDPAERILQLQGDQLKLKKKDKLKAKIFVYYVWVQSKISDYVPRESHRLKDESLAVIAGWHKDLMIVTFATKGEKENFLLEFHRINKETVHSLFKEHAEPSEHCLVNLGSCISSTLPPSTSAVAMDTAQTISVKLYETANDVALKCKQAFKLDKSLRAALWLESSSGYCMVGCESIFSAILYEIHDRHKTTNRRRGSILSEASSNSPNESNSMELDETVGREASVTLSLHLQDTCAGASCASRKKKAHHHNLQLRRTSEVPSKIRNWFASDNRRSQLIRHGSVETLAASNGGGVACEPSPIIGRPLTELYPLGIVSRPVTCLLAQIYHRCYATRGIFRQPGSVSEKNQVLQLISHYDMTSKGDNMKQLNEFGEHCIADALKHYLRNLPGCLLQSNLSSQWIPIVRDQAEPPPKAVAAIRSVIRQMQPQNAHLLHMLMATLRRVADHHSQNQMTATNIGTSVSFSVLELSPQGSSLGAMEQEAQWVNRLIELMITNYSQIWPDEAENDRVRADFVRHICQHDDLSSMESLINDGVRNPDTTTEPLSLSSLSKDSGLQLSDQQLDENRRGTSGPVGITIVPERSQPPPYDIALKRQGRTGHRSRNPEHQESLEPPAPITPRRERPPVPARLHKRPASLGPSGRLPLPATAALVAAASNENGNGNGSSDSSASNGNLAQSASFLAGSRTRHPLSTTVGRQPVTSPPQQPPLTLQSSARPVRGVASVAAVTAAAAAAAATQPPPVPPLQWQPQPRFRKRSSSETRLDLLGLGPAPLPQGPQQIFFQHHNPAFQHPRDAAAQHRRQEFERLSRLHNRDSLDFTVPQGAATSVAALSARTPFSSRHAPIRGGGNPDLAGGSPRQPRPRTRLPEALQRKLADQPESLV